MTVEAKCPFCSGHIQASDGADGGQPRVLHTVPQCDEFADADDALDFLEKANQRTRERLGLSRGQA